MECNKVVRQIVKISSISGVIPTIPVSDDHSDGSWLSTDIYKGELFFNQADGILYTRSDNGIEVVGGGEGEVLEYEAIISQTGIADPVATVYKNTIGAIVWTRFDKGAYLGTLAGAFPEDRTALLCGNTTAHTTKFGRNSTDVLTIRTFNSSATLQDELLVEAYVYIKIFPSLAS